MKSNRTLGLLTSSIFISVSGVCRLDVALLLSGGSHPAAVYVGCGLAVYGTYTLDRSVDSEEDAVNRSGLAGSSKEVGILVSVVAFFLSLLLLWPFDLHWLVFLPTAIGVLYSKGLPLGDRRIRLKADYGVKNLVVASTWAMFITLFAPVRGFASVAIFLFFFGKSFVNSAIYDFRDIRGDSAAGLMTLPVALGGPRARALLYLVHLSTYLMVSVAILYGLLTFLPTILALTFFLGVTYIYLYGRQPGDDSGSTGRHLLVNGEFVHAVALRRATALLPL